MLVHFSDGNQPRWVPIALYWTEVLGNGYHQEYEWSRGVIAKEEDTELEKLRMDKVLKVCIILTETQSLFLFYKRKINRWLKHGL